MPELDRREFLKVVGLGAGAAATVACEEPVRKIIPYLNQPEEIVPGVATWYASTCRECPNACSIQVKTREGRPIKVEGNPDDPVTGGKVCVRGQAGLYRSYDAYRFRGPMKRQGDKLVPTSWEEALATVAARLRAALDSGKVAWLGPQDTRVSGQNVEAFMDAIGGRQPLRYETLAWEALRSANERIFAVDAIPRFDFAASDLVVSFGADFEETWLNPVENQRGYADARRGGKGFGVWVGPRLSMTGADMDQWIAPEPGTEILIALALANEVARKKGSDLGNARAALSRFTAASVAAETGVDAELIEQLAERIAKAHAPLALPPGNELLGANGTAFAAAVQLLNLASGAIGTTVRFGPNRDLGKLGRFRSMKELAGYMRGGEVAVLFVKDVNPVYSVPEAFGFEDALEQVPFVVSFSSANDETTAHADLVLPDNTPFESWDELEPVSGLRVLQQPTLRPLFDTRPTGEVLAELARSVGRGERMSSGDSRAAVAAGFPGRFEAVLAKGGEGAPAGTVSVSLRNDLSGLDFSPAPLEGEGELTLLAYPSLHFYDGRSARIQRLQEVPDPVTKTMWGSYAELHPDTAKRLDLEKGDVVRVRTSSGQIELPVFPHEALRPGVVAVAIGQGHRPVDPDLNLSESWQNHDWLGLRDVHGVNVLSVLPGKIDPVSGGLAWLSAKASVEKTGERRHVVASQGAFEQQGRGIAQETTLAAVLGQEPAPRDAPELIVKDYDPARDSAPDSPYRWGMTIDLDACSGCNACITACAQENNTPTVGEEMVRVGREMQWIRLERYVDKRDDELDVRKAVMLCQQCGAAPCENVCPVYATYHTGEGLNAMVYNRCIGTRYCSNNCPYKVRRFNYLPYDFMVPEPENWALNPDVTVRTKGVMEKCTFCVQRIQEKKFEAKRDGRLVKDGEITPACAQTCPSEAIVFGNLKDPGSRVSKSWQEPRAYTALEQLNTRPAVGSLKQIDRRPRKAGAKMHGGGHEGSGHS